MEKGAPANVSKPLDGLRWGGGWIIIMWKLEELPCSFPILWAHLSLFSAFHPVQAPHSSLLLLPELQHTTDDCERLSCLWAPTQATESCSTPPHPPPSSTSLCFGVDVAHSPGFKCFKAPKVLTCEPKPKHAGTWCYLRQRCCWLAWRIPICMRFTLFLGGIKGKLGRGGAKWATVPSLTLVEQKMSHACSQTSAAYSPVMVLFFTWLQLDSREADPFYGTQLESSLINKRKESSLFQSRGLCSATG